MNLIIISNILLQILSFIIDISKYAILGRIFLPIVYYLKVIILSISNFQLGLPLFIIYDFHMLIISMLNDTESHSYLCYTLDFNFF